MVGNVFEIKHDSKVFITLELEGYGQGSHSGHLVNTEGTESALFIINLGGIEIPQTINFSFYHGNESNKSDAELIPDDFLISDFIVDSVLTVTDGDAFKTISAGYIGKKQYVYIDLEVIEVTSGDELNAIAVLTTNHHQPTLDEKVVAL